MSSSHKNIQIIISKTKQRCKSKKKIGCIVVVVVVAVVVHLVFCNASFVFVTFICISR